MYFSAESKAKRNAEQAADKSNPKAFLAPILSAIKHAVEGKSMSGVTVAQIIKSISSAEILRFFNNKLMAFAAMSDVANKGSFKILLS